MVVNPTGKTETAITHKTTHPLEATPIADGAGRYLLTKAGIRNSIVPDARRHKAQMTDRDFVNISPLPQAAPREKAKLITYKEKQTVQLHPQVNSRANKPSIQVQPGVSLAELCLTLLPNLKEAKQAYAEDRALKHAPKQHTEVAHA